jgi:hypothetical protein
MRSDGYIQRPDEAPVSCSLFAGLVDTDCSLGELEVRGMLETSRSVASLNDGPQNLLVGGDIVPGDWSILPESQLWAIGAAVEDGAGAGGTGGCCWASNCCFLDCSSHAVRVLWSTGHASAAPTLSAMAFCCQEVDTMKRDGVASLQNFWR